MAAEVILGRYYPGEGNLSIGCVEIDGGMMSVPAVSVWGFPRVRTQGAAGEAAFRLSLSQVHGYKQSREERRIERVLLNTIKHNVYNVN